MTSESGRRLQMVFSTAFTVSGTMVNQAISLTGLRNTYEIPSKIPLGMLMKLFQERINSECEHHHPIGWDWEGRKLRAKTFSFCALMAMTGSALLCGALPTIMDWDLWNCETNESFLLQGVFLRHFVTAAENLSDTASILWMVIS